MNVRLYFIVETQVSGDKRPLRGKGENISTWEEKDTPHLIAYHLTRETGRDFIVKVLTGDTETP